MNPEAFDRAIDDTLARQKMTQAQQARAAKQAYSASLSDFLNAPWYAQPTFRQMQDEDKLTNTPAPPDPLEQLQNERDENLDRAAVGEIPEIKPAFLGLRNVINERLLERNEKKIREQTDLARSAAFVGRIIARGKFGETYGKSSENPLLQPPQTRKEKKFAKSLERTAEKRYQTIGSRAHMDMYFGEDDSRLRQKINGQLLDRRDLTRPTPSGVRLHNPDSRHHIKVAKQFSKMETLQEKRQSLLLKQEAIANAAQIKEEKKQSKKGKHRKP